MFRWDEEIIRKPTNLSYEHSKINFLVSWNRWTNIVIKVVKSNGIRKKWHILE